MSDHKPSKAARKLLANQKKTTKRAERRESDVITTEELAAMTPDERMQRKRAIMIADGQDPDSYTCTCGKACTWDDDSRGTTCGGLALQGAWVCACGKSYIGLRSHEAEDWFIASGGRSIETGVGRIRIDGGNSKVEKLVERISKLPALELEVKKLRAEREARLLEREHIRVLRGELVRIANHIEGHLMVGGNLTMQSVIDDVRGAAKMSIELLPDLDKP